MIKNQFSNGMISCTLIQTPRRFQSSENKFHTTFGLRYKRTPLICLFQIVWNRLIHAFITGVNILNTVKLTKVPETYAGTHMKCVIQCNRLLRYTHWLKDARNHISHIFHFQFPSQTSSLTPQWVLLCQWTVSMSMTHAFISSLRLI